MSTHELMVLTSIQGYCRCGQWGMASDGGLDRLRELHAQHIAEVSAAATLVVTYDPRTTSADGLARTLLTVRGVEVVSAMPSSPTKREDGAA